MIVFFNEGEKGARIQSENVAARPSLSMWGKVVVIQDICGVTHSSGMCVDLGRGLKLFGTSLLGIGTGVITTFPTRGLVRLNSIEAVRDVK